MSDFIKPASTDDYTDLLAIWESAVMATHSFLNENDFRFYRERIPTYFEHVSLYIYQDETGIPKGFVGVSEDEIEMLFIHNTYRRQGIGAELLAFAIAKLGKRKVSVNEQNIDALAFYERFGFKIKSRSERDAEGKNYPILHLTL